MAAPTTISLAELATSLPDAFGPDASAQCEPPLVTRQSATGACIDCIFFHEDDNTNFEFVTSQGSMKVCVPQLLDEAMCHGVIQVVVKALTS